MVAKRVCYRVAMGRVARLRALLDGYRAVSEGEAEHVAAVQRLTERGEACLSRTCFDPGHVTASAFILDPDDRLLLILHEKLGLWLQPGGHVELTDRDVEESARREVREEVGIGDLTLLTGGLFDVDVHDIPAGKDPPHQHFDVRFAFRTTQRNATPRSDALAARWLALDAVGSVQSDRSVMRAVERLRRWTAHSRLS